LQPAKISHRSLSADRGHAAVILVAKGSHLPLAYPPLDYAWHVTALWMATGAMPGNTSATQRNIACLPRVRPRVVADGEHGAYAPIILATPVLRLAGEQPGRQSPAAAARGHERAGAYSMGPGLAFRG
jgi:hypothetical protein